MVEKSSRQYQEEIKTIRRQLVNADQLKAENLRTIEELRENQRIYLALAENNPDWTFWLDADDRLVYISPSCRRLTGYDPEEFKKDAKLLFKMIHPDDRPAFDEHLRFVHKSKSHAEEEFRIIRKDKKTRWISHVCQPVYDAEGQYAGVLSSNRDITESKSTGPVSPEGGKFYRLVAENMGDVVWTTDLNLQMTYVSPSVSLLRGYPAEEAVKQNLRDALSEASLQKFNEVWSAELAQERPGKVFYNRSLILQLEFKCKDGSTIWTESRITPLRDDDKKIIEILGVSRDITELKQTQENLIADEIKLKQSESQLKALLNAATESIFLMDKDGHILFANEKTAHHLGTDLETLLKEGDINKYLLPDVAMNLRQYILQVQKTGKPVHFQEDLSGRMISSSIYPAVGEDGKVSALAVFSLDITDRKNSDAAVVDSQRRLAEAENKTQQLEAQLRKTETQLQEIQNLFGEAENMSKQFENQLRETETQLREKQNRLTEAETKSQQFENLLRKTETQFQENQTRLQNTENKLQQTETQLQDAENKLSQNESRLQQTESRLMEGGYQTRQSENQLRAILNAATETIFLMDTGGKVLCANEMTAQRLGVDLQTLLAGPSIFEFLPPAVAEKRKKFVTTIQKTGQPLQFEDERNGRTILNSLYPIKNEDGKVTQLAVFGMDITDRKMAEQTVDENRRLAAAANRMFRQVIDSIPVRVFWKDLNSVYLGSNLLFARDAGKDNIENLIGNKDQNLAWHNRAKQYRQDDLEIMASGKPKINYEENLTLPDGKQSWFKKTKVPLTDTDGRVIGVLGVYDDITEQKVAVENLAESEKRYRSLFENNHMAMLLIDPVNGTIMDANAAAVNYSGWSKEDLLRRKLSDVTTMSIREMTKQMNMALTQKRKNFIFKYKRADGSIRDVEVFSGPLQFHGKTFLYTMIYDITDRIQMEGALRQTDKLDALGILAGGIAHDFNNLMTVVQGNIDVALLTLPEGDAACQSLNAAQNAVEKTRDLTSRLITFSRGGTPVVKICRVENLLGDAARTSLKSSPVELILDIPADLWPAEVDQQQIKQCFSRLADNAAEAMPDGGTLIIRAENTDITEADALPLAEGPYLKIIFEDSGTGISGEHISKIFDPYFSTKPLGKDKGMGLGLAVCHSVLKKHGGYITVSSDEGRGATFTLYLPAKPGSVVEEEPAVIESTPPIKRILIMDDNEEIRKILEIYIERLGYDSAGVADGQKAIQTYKEAQEAGDAFSAVFMEISVKQGLGGKATLAKLKNIDPDVKAVAILSENDSRTQDFLDLGFEDVLGKPFRLEDMKKVLNSIFKS